MRPQTLTRALAAGSATAICTSQTPGGAGALLINGQLNNIFTSQTPGAGAGQFTINGILAFASQVMLDSERKVSFNSAGNFSAATITIKGTNAAGQPVTEALVGPNAGTVNSVNTYKTVNAITYTASPGAVAVTCFTSVAVLDAQRVVLFTPAANESARTFVVSGLDESGMAISESFLGANAVPFSSTLNFKTVQSITIDGAATGAITVGTSAVGASKPVAIDKYISPTNLRIGVELVSGAANYDVQYTYDDIFDPAAISSLVWTSITGLTNKSATLDDQTLIAPVSAVRLKTNSGTGTLKLIVQQPGNGL